MTLQAYLAALALSTGFAAAQSTRITSIPAPVGGAAAPAPAPPRIVLRNLGYAVNNYGPWASENGRRIVIGVDEAAQGAQDLNGDGDSFDIVPVSYDTSTDVTLEHGTATGLFGNDSISVAPLNFMFMLSESGEGLIDFNGDGDTDDYLAQTYDFSTSTTINHGLATSVGSLESRGRHSFFTDDSDVYMRYDIDSAVLVSTGLRTLVREGTGRGRRFWLSDSHAFIWSWIPNTSPQVQQAWVDRYASGFGLASVASVTKDMSALLVGHVLFNADSESAFGDLNSDGDTDDRVLRMHNLETGNILNCRAAVDTAPSGGFWIEPEGDATVVGFWASEEGQGADLNGDGDLYDLVAHSVDPGTGLVRNHMLAYYTSDPVLNNMPVTSYPYGLQNDAMLARDGTLLFLGSERAQGADLDGDGTMNGNFVFVFDVESSSLRRLDEFSVVGNPIFPAPHFAYNLNFACSIEGRHLLLKATGGPTYLYDLALNQCREIPQGDDIYGSGFVALFDSAVASIIGEFSPFPGSPGTDYNHDGDFLDYFVRTETLPIHVVKYTEIQGMAYLSNPQDTYQERSGAFSRFGHIGFMVDESSKGVDLNGDGDALDQVAHVLSIYPR